MIEFSIAPVVERFEHFVVAVVIADGIRTKPAQQTEPVLADLLAKECRAAVARVGGREFGSIPEFACWRQAYKAFGVRGTSFRSSVERLVRLAMREDRPWTRIGPLVDAYNVVSVRHFLPVGCDDLAVVKAPMGFRYAREGDRFVPLGSPAEAVEAPDPAEVVYADSRRVLCRRWNWYQAAETAVTDNTRRAVLTIQALTPDSRRSVETAMRDLDELLGTLCGSRQDVAILDASRPTHIFDLPG